jgi:hypothetical protein
VSAIAGILPAGESFTGGKVTGTSFDYARELHEAILLPRSQRGLNGLTDEPVYRQAGAARFFPKLFEEFLGEANRECVTHVA